MNYTQEQFAEKVLEIPDNEILNYIKNNNK